MQIYNVYEPDNVYALLNDPGVNDGDEIDYSANNQEGNTKFKVIKQLQQISGKGGRKSGRKTLHKNKKNKRRTHKRRH